MSKVLIGIPFGQSQSMIPHQAWTALIVKASANPNYTACGEYATAASIGFNREYIAGRSLEKGCDWCLMVDTDMSYPDNLLDVLMSRDKDVIGVPYYSGVWSPTGTKIVPILYNYNEKKDSWVRQKKVEQTELFKVDGMGGGVMLIKTDVFKKLDKPWFLHGKHGDKTHIMGEDVYFCSKCSDAGIDIWQDPTFGDKVKHWHMYGYSKKDCSEGGSTQRLPIPT